MKVLAESVGLMWLGKIMVDALCKILLKVFHRAFGLSLFYHIVVPASSLFQ